MTLPVVQEFQTQGPLTFTDTLTLDKVEYRAQHDQGQANLINLISQDRTTPLCQTSTEFNRKISEDWRTAKKANPSLAFDTFLAGFDAGLDDTACDPRLIEMSFVVKEGQSPIGVWFVYNVKLTAPDAQGVIHAEGYPAPGYVFADTQQGRSAWERRVRFSMEAFFQPRDLVGGGQLVFDCWDFPTEQSGHAWEGPGSPSWVQDLTARLRQDHPHETNNGLLRRINRV